MIQSLAYFGLTSPALAEWSTFGTDILGCAQAPPGRDGAVRLRIDDAAYRLAIHPGDTDTIAYMGWAVSNEYELEEYTDRLTSAGVEVHTGDAQTIADREVAAMKWFLDPYGNRHEIVWGQKIEPATFRPGRPMSGFVSGDQGLGHLVLVVPEQERANDFYCRVMGFRLSDRVADGNVDIRFYHVNSRHHSLAVVAVPNKVGLNHLMLETRSLDDVGVALDLCRERGVPITLTLGRHVNDHMTSFYVATPSGFQIEYGWGGLTVDDATWLPASYDKASIWGHEKTADYGLVPKGIMDDYQPCTLAESAPR